MQERNPLCFYVSGAIFSLPWHLAADYVEYGIPATYLPRNPDSTAVLVLGFGVLPDEYVICLQRAVFKAVFYDIIRYF